jgi:hypothetical protein
VQGHYDAISHVDVFEDLKSHVLEHLVEPGEELPDPLMAVIGVSVR